jgi:tight adherence protein B
MSAVLGAVGLAVLLWPRTRQHLRALALIPSTRVPRVMIGDPAALVSVAFACAALVAFGGAAAAAASMAAAMGYSTVVSRRRAGEASGEMNRLLAALEVMIAELRVGAHPAYACRQAAQDCADRANTFQMLQMMAGRAALGGDVAGGIEQVDSKQRDSWLRVAVAWRTAEQYGLPMAELLASVRSDLLARNRFRERTRAALAGAKATALVLALLPVLGIVLGQAIGAAPLSVLLGGGLGGVLLVVGTGLVCSGLLWSRRIVGKVTAL